MISMEETKLVVFIAGVVFFAVAYVDGDLLWALFAAAAIMWAGGYWE